MADETVVDPFGGNAPEPPPADIPGGNQAALAALTDSVTTLQTHLDTLPTIRGHQALGMAKASLGFALDALQREIEHITRTIA